MINPNPYIVTRHGHQIHYLNPSPDSIDIRDIAHSLSRIVRFGGHTKTPYYVAQHVCLCCDAIAEPYKHEALMHDSAEAYVGDCPAPLKSLLPQFHEAESRLETVIAAKFGYSFPYPDEVRQIDRVLLVTEIRDLTGRDDFDTMEEWPLFKRITPWSSERARREFMKRFRRLFG